MTTSTHATLYIFSGLPGTGKSALAQRLASQLGAVYLRIDTIEQALRDLCQTNVQGEGYRLSYRIANDNLLLGSSVVADSCNPLELTRNEWMNVAKRSQSDFINIQVVCSDITEHQRRVETRAADILGLSLPLWDQVQAREYHPWTTVPITVDTANKSIDSCFQELLTGLACHSA